MMYISSAASVFKERSTIPDGCFRNRFPQGNFARLDGTRAPPPLSAQGSPSSDEGSKRYPEDKRVGYRVLIKPLLSAGENLLLDNYSQREEKTT